MTKYICECFEGAKRCTHETTGSCPTLCCVRAHATCHWRKVENQEVETPATTLPDWCKVGAWVWFSGAKDIGYEPGYLKITDVGYNGMENVIYADGITNVPLSVVKQARLRPWTYKEAIGKIVFWKGDYDYQENAAMIVGADTDGDFSLYTVGPVTAEELTKEIYYQPDGSSCGVFEHKNENGEWVE